MTSVQQGWICPLADSDWAPLPALHIDGKFAIYNRKEGSFSAFTYSRLTFYTTFDECRLALVNCLTEELNESRQRSYDLAAAVEHVKMIPTVPFPSDAIRQGDRQEEAVQEEAKAEEVKPAKAELKRPRRN
jgi:hypothetical protein